jgi:hypothetical protein
MDGAVAAAEIMSELKRVTRLDCERHADSGGAEVLELSF